jgi:hypothetical protein
MNVAARIHPSTALGVTLLSRVSGAQNLPMSLPNYRRAERERAIYGPSAFMIF